MNNKPKVDNPLHDLPDDYILAGARDEYNPWKWDYRREAERRGLTFWAREQKEK